MTHNRLFRPSAANYWGNCAAYVSFIERVPEDGESDAAREGTCAAWLADIVLNGDADTCEDMLDAVHENGWAVDEEMVGLIQEYVDMIKARGGVNIPERKLRISDNPLIEGTPDNSTRAIMSGVLCVDDLKYGRRLVEAVDNKQLTIYGWGEYQMIPDVEREHIHTIHLSIYQPRAFHTDGIYRTWTVTPHELYEAYVKLWHMACEGNKPEPLATAGTHCADCRVATSCQALAATSYSLVDTIVSREMRSMTAQELSRELDFIAYAEKTTKARFKAVKAESEARAKNEKIPNYAVRQRYGMPVLTQSTVNVQLITGVDPTDTKICTPAELKRRGADPDIVDKISEKPLTGLKLTRMSKSDYTKMFEPLVERI